MKSLILGAAIVLASISVASADDMNQMQGDRMHPHMHGMMRHPHCMTMTKTVHRHGKTISQTVKKCH